MESTLKVGKNKMEVSCECGLTHIIIKGEDDNYEMETFYKKGVKEKLEKESKEAAEKLKAETTIETKTEKKESDWLT